MINDLLADIPKDKYLTSRECYVASGEWSFENGTWTHPGLFESVVYDQYQFPRCCTVYCDETFKQAHPEFHYRDLGWSGVDYLKNGRNILTLKGVFRMHQYGGHLLFFNKTDRDAYRALVKAQQKHSVAHRERQEEIYRIVYDATPEQVIKWLKMMKE